VRRAAVNKLPTVIPTATAKIFNIGITASIDIPPAQGGHHSTLP
jgi:hypothetical protein